MLEYYAKRRGLKPRSLSPTVYVPHPLRSSSNPRPPSLLDTTPPCASPRHSEERSDAHSGLSYCRYMSGMHISPKGKSALFDKNLTEVSGVASHWHPWLLLGTPDVSTLSDPHPACNPACTSAQVIHFCWTHNFDSKFEKIFMFGKLRVSKECLRDIDACKFGPSGQLIFGVGSDVPKLPANAATQWYDRCDAL